MNYDWELLAAGVHRCRLPFLDVTVGLVCGSAGVLLIDCGTTLIEADGIAEDVRELTGGAVTHIVLTHHHFDHILGSGGFHGAQLYAAPPVADALTAGTAEVRREALSYGAPSAEVDRAIASLRAPERVVTWARIDLGDRVIAIEHPGSGHTDHDRTVVFCGDLIEESADPAIGPDSEVAAWPATLDRLLAAGGSGAIYVPGHGAVVDADFVVRQRDWLANHL